MRLVEMLDGATTVGPCDRTPPFAKAPMSTSTNFDPVMRKIERSILPYLLSAERLTREPHYRAYLAYTYTHEILAGLAGMGFGVAFPTLRMLVSDGSGGEAAIAALPIVPLVVVVICVALWLGLKTYVTRDDGLKRALLVRSCVREMAVARHAVVTALDRADAVNPLAEVTKAQNVITGIVEKYIQEGVWPYRIVAAGIDVDVRAEAARLSQHYGLVTSPPRERDEPPPAPAGDAGAGQPASGPTAPDTGPGPGEDRDPSPH
jgi:hypothetical protein